MHPQLLHRLSGHGGDEVEILVDVQHSQPARFGEPAQTWWGERVEIVRIDPSDEQLFGRWLMTKARTFLDPLPTPDEIPQRAARRIGRGERDRVFAAFDGDEIVATFESYDADAPVVVAPGSPGRLVDVENITGVTVAATHRRQGLLTRWMTADLRDAKERGMPLASLIASEARIYGRYGFGTVIDSARWSVQTSQPLRVPATGCSSGTRHSVRFADEDEVRAVVPDLYDAARVHQPGAAPRDGYAWHDILKIADGDRRPRLTFLHRDADGIVDGYAKIIVTESWTNRAPASIAEFSDMAVSRPDVLPCLWRACLGLDLVVGIEATDRPLGDPIPELMADRRAARQVDRSDLYWWRILDVPAALTSRWWAGPGRVTLDVRDDLALAAGRWRLDVDAEGQAEVTATTASADLTLGVDSLASLLAGQGSPHRLAAAGQVDEHTDGALAALDRLAWAPQEAYVTYTWF